MKLLTKRNLLFIGSGAFLLFLCLGIRLINLTKIPVFADEAIYIRWAQVMRAEPTLRFLPLSDGKQPLFMWIVIPFLKIFSDPLISGRIVSVLCGVTTCLGIGALSFLLFKSKRAALLSSFLYTFSPFSFFFDRLALVDSMLTMFGVWFLVFLTISVKKMRWDFSMLAGFALGAALLTKSPGLFFLLLIPVSAFLAHFPKSKNARAIYSLKLFGLWITTIVIGYGMSQVMRLGPNFQMIASRNLDYVFPANHIFQDPKDPFIFNLDRALEWLFILGPVWILALSLLGVFKKIKNQPKELLFLLAFFAGPFLVGCMYARVFTARYVLYTLPPLFVISGLSALYLNKLRLITVSLVFIFLSHALYLNFLFISNPTAALLPQSERSGYLQEWSAGWGIKESAEIILAEHNTHPEEKILVGTEGYFGTLPDGLQMYLEKIPNVVVIGTGLDFKKIPEQLLDAKKSGSKVYFAVNSSRINKEMSFEGLNKLLSIDKPLRTDGTHEFVAFGPRETYFLFELK